MLNVLKKFTLKGHLNSYQARVAADIAQLYGSDGQSVRHTGIFVPGQAEVC